MRDINKYYTYYLKTKSISKVSKKFKICTKTLKNKFLQEGFKYPLDNYNRKYSFQDNYFENINTSAKAYILGFIFADGCLYHRKRGNGEEWVLSFNIKYDDIEILEFIKSELKSEHKIKRQEPSDFIAPNGKHYTRHAQARFSISSKKLGTDLYKFISPRKTYSLNFPKLKENLMSHFIRGYFDGDGCISVTDKIWVGKQKTTHYKKGTCLFTIKDEKFAMLLEKYLKKNGINFNLNYNYSKKVCTLGSSAKKELLNFYNFIYTDGFFLERKRIKFSPLIEQFIR